MSDLIKRLRDVVEEEAGYGVRNEAADALEAANSRIAALERILDGLPQDAIDGGWTARGISAHAKKLETRNAYLEDLNRRIIEKTDEFDGRSRARIKELEAQLAAADGWPKDAERYGWLRQQHWNEADMFVVVGSKSQVRLGTDCPNLTRLDEAIDAARAKQRAQEGKW